MGKNKQFRELLSEIDPLITFLSGTSDYKKLRFTQDDVSGFLYEKVYDVWIKYDQLPYPEVKAIAIASCYNLRTKIYKKYSREVSLGEVDVEEIIEETNTDFQLMDQACAYLDEEQALVLRLLMDPPLYITEKSTHGKRIPSNLILEYLDMEITKKTVKALNTFRRNIFSSLEEKVNPYA